MNEKRHLRYDPLYRVIDMKEEIRFIEGNFRPFFDRLKWINNLGIIPEILEMAKYPKYEHHLGTLFQVNCFLESVRLKDKYCMPLKLSALFMHIGHLPFTYSTERALLLASTNRTLRGSNRAGRYIEERVKRVLKAINMNSEEQQKHLKNIYSLEDIKILYRYFSCNIFLENWKKIKKEFKLKDEQKETIIRNLIDRKNDGYRYLELADKADFVQRDALYFGTVRLDISPKHLYGPELLGEESESFLVDERKLLESNLDYLRERFYESDKARWFSRLFEKIVAYLILDRNFRMEWLAEFDDSQFKRLITENVKPDTKKAKLPAEWTKRTKELFDGETSFSPIFKLSEISFERDNNIIDIEHKIIQTRRSFRKLVTYPFEKGLLLDISHLRKPRYPALLKYRQSSLTLFQNNVKREFAELLKIIQQLSKYCSITHVEEIRKGLGNQISWTNSTRIDNKKVIESISEAILVIESRDELRRGTFVAKFLKNLESIKSFDSLWHNFENRAFWLTYIRHYVEEHNEYIEEAKIPELFVEGISSLPLRILQYKSTRKYLDRIYEALLEMISETDSNDKKGHLFEALFLVKKMGEKKGNFQFLINNLIIVDPTKEKRERDLHEFDVIEFLINENNKPECWIYACSTGEKYKQDNEEQIKELAESIHKTYPDLKITSKYVIPKNRAKGDWKPKEEETGVGIWGI